MTIYLPQKKTTYYTEFHSVRILFYLKRCVLSHAQNISSPHLKNHLNSHSKPSNWTCRHFLFLCYSPKEEAHMSFLRIKLSIFFKSWIPLTQGCQVYLILAHWYWKVTLKSTKYFRFFVIISHVTLHFSLLVDVLCQVWLKIACGSGEGF